MKGHGWIALVALSQIAGIGLVVGGTVEVDPFPGEPCDLDRDGCTLFGTQPPGKDQPVTRLIGPRDEADGHAVADDAVERDERAGWLMLVFMVLSFGWMWV